jgi:hypothetical protein
MSRDDFFTQIHKGLRKALFDLTIAAGATNWADRVAVEELMAAWTPLHELLLSHSVHEDEHFFPLAESKRPGSTRDRGGEHAMLDALLDSTDEVVRHAAATSDSSDGLAAYRALARFVGAYLPHLDQEETVVMPVIWATTTDEELARTRSRFMASVPPDQLTLSAQLMLAALDPVERADLERRIAAATGA